MSDLEGVKPETVTIPKAALDWLMGAGPDPAGFWFGDFPEDHPKPRGAFWWRRTFNDILAHYAALSPSPVPAPLPGSGETGALLSEARYRVGNPSAWDSYDERASEIIRQLLAVIAANPAETQAVEVGK